MAKIQQISEKTPSFAFTEFDFYKDYEESFRKSELGRFHALLPVDGLSFKFILAERQEARNHILCQHGQERTCPCTSHSNGRVFWNAEGTLRSQAYKRPNQENGNPDHLLRYPHG